MEIDLGLPEVIDGLSRREIVLTERAVGSEIAQNMVTVLVWNQLRRLTNRDDDRSSRSGHRASRARTSEPPPDLTCRTSAGSRHQSRNRPTRRRISGSLFRRGRQLRGALGLGEFGPNHGSPPAREPKSRFLNTGLARGRRDEAFGASLHHPEHRRARLADYLDECCCAWHARCSARIGVIHGCDSSLGKFVGRGSSDIRVEAGSGTSSSGDPVKSGHRPVAPQTQCQRSKSSASQRTQAWLCRSATRAWIRSVHLRRPPSQARRLGRARALV